MNAYEGVFIIDPEIDDVKQAEELAGIKDVISKNGGTLGREESWGRKRLAFCIERRPRKFTEGTYHLLRFELDPAKIKELNRAYRMKEAIIRHVILRRG